MELGQASVSAMGSGVLRAAHVKEDALPWVFEDIVAERLLTDAEVAEIEGSMAEWAPEVRAGFRLAQAVRARPRRRCRDRRLRSRTPRLRDLGRRARHIRVASPTCR
jgi:hypothetical protein